MNVTPMMKPYHDLLADILKNGRDLKNERTGEVCRYVIGRQLQFDMSGGEFPAITTKKLAFKTMTAELLGFFRGYDNARQFEADGCGIWTANADATTAWLANPYRRGAGDMGAAYPTTWTRMPDRRVATTEAERERLVAAGFTETLHDLARGAWLLERKINQVEDCLRTILTNPTSRQNLLSGWRPDLVDQACLPPCHLDYIWSADPIARRLDLTVTQRSYDTFLAFNIPTGGLFLAIMAQLSGYTPGTLTLQVANAHIYHNHFEQVREQLSRDHFPAPCLRLGDSIPRITSVDEVNGAFTRIQAGDIQLLNYQHHPALKAPMAA